MISTKEIAWLAGLLEGEGCFVWTPYNNNGDKERGRPRIILTICDKDVIQRARNLMGVGREIYVDDREGRKSAYQLYLTGTDAAAWMMTLYTLLGERRRSQIRDVLKKWRVQPKIHRYKSKEDRLVEHFFNNAPEKLLERALKILKG